MKKIAYIAALALMGATPAFAQKIGHINVDSLLVIMPEYTVAMENLQNEQAKMEAEAKEMQAELEKGAQLLQAKANEWTELRQKQEQQRLQEAYSNIQEYMQNAQQVLQTKEVEALTPILEKMQKAIDEVATSMKLSYVLDSSRSKGQIVFSKNGENLMKSVKAKLAIK